MRSSTAIRPKLALLLALPLLGQTYRVQTTSGIQTIDPEAYVAAVVTGESGTLQNDEALKAMAVAARSYAARMQGRHASEGFDFCATTHCQRYAPPSPRATNAAQSTAGQILWFQGQPAFAVYSQNCGDRTEAVSAVWPQIAAPYLLSHADPYCGSLRWTWSASIKQITSALKDAGLHVPPDPHTISIVATTASGRAKMISLDGDLISASTFRFAVCRRLGWNTIRSLQFTLETSGPRVFFRGSGEGHGVGLCQIGADHMAAAGKNYREILAFYYPGTTLSETSLQLAWRQISGERVILHSIAPESDMPAIQAAEAAIRRWSPRLPWSPPPELDLFVYPTIAAFRDATAEPGWVAARTQGTKIQLQPTAVLASRNALHATIEHEVLHAFIENAAKPGLPVWFREGLVEHLTRPSSQAANSALKDNALRQRQSRQEAERAYAQAAATVDSLIARYGETAVLSWVAGGIPSDVMNSINSNPPVKTR